MTRSAPVVYFVDDDVSLLEGLRRCLFSMRSRWDMHFFSESHEALAAFSARAADIVVSDLHMPEIDGIALVSQLKEIDFSGRSRFLFLTGNGDFQSAMRAINELHVYRFLQKPIVRDSLVEAIEEALAELNDEGLMQGRHAAATLDMLNASVLVVGGGLRLLYANPAGRRMLERPGGITLGADNVCRVAASDEGKALKEMVGDCLADPESRVRWCALEASDGSACISLVAIPQSDAGRGNVILLCGDASAHSSMSLEALQALFGLSPAEAAIVLALSRGERLEDAARISGVTLSSARTYLKRAFMKTGVGRQADLVKLVLTSPAALVDHQR